ncbi:DPP IV N-terminal domain-containing protein [candidate division KSB1 bacterium]
MKKILSILFILLFLSCAINTLFEPNPIPDPRTLIAYQYPVNEVWQICIMNPDGSNKQVLTAHESLCSFPNWSPDGTKIAYHSDSDLYYYDLINSSEHIITNSQMTPYFHIWGPDGLKLAFRSWEQSSGAIYTINVDGSGLKKITPEDHNTNDFPSWSPDGQTIVYESDFNIYTVKSDGTANTQITFGDDRNDRKDSPVFSPDGSRIYFRHRPSSNIYMMNPDGSGMINLTESIYIEHFSISPDGLKIAYTSDKDIWIMDSDGRNKTNLTNEIIINSNPRWSPDGELIVYSTFSNESLSSGPRISDEDYSYIAVMRADGSEKKIITPIRDSIVLGYSASFSPYIDW